MASFKSWIEMTENLMGPGGGPEPQPEDLEALNKEIASKGAGAFHQGGGNPPKVKKPVTANYADSRFNRKAMKKH